MKPQAFFITGTDTEIGKTTAACALLAAARQQGLSCAAVKPVAAGCVRTAQGLRNDDALLLQAQCQPPLGYEQINPLALEPAIAPHLAALECGEPLSVARLLPEAQAVLGLQRDLTVVEGAGGWRVPLNAEETLADLAKALRLPVILVVGLRLGCINHALLSAEAIIADGLPLAGWIGNTQEPDMARFEDNLATLTARLPAPCLGVLPRLSMLNYSQLAEHLRWP